jgi:hypothetical protein
VFFDGEVIASEMLQPEYVREQPEARECGVCEYASAELEATVDAV